MEAKQLHMLAPPQSKGATGLVVAGNLAGLSLPRAETGFLAFAVNVSQTCPHHYVFYDECWGKPPVGRVGSVMRIHKVHEHRGVDFLLLKALVNPCALGFHPRRLSGGGCSCPAIHYADQIGLLHRWLEFFPTRIVGNEYRVCSGRHENRQDQCKLNKWPDHESTSNDERQATRARPAALDLGRGYRTSPPPLEREPAENRPEEE
ncbi:hypothetical protein SAMN05216228_100246 [Rhizobium tibeticum]|uniref:Uncharacterized protein n=1 Tax=Rhizobium tibeticum TaxID=501024 RepID=A0A1H8DID2_9HYPH|nr:hypothetical protein RTCCBAU85039_0867 [Rhizobium tibeticum]SEN06278.1 hypothetical protein SAMN05216228_100246 [Rhizobium tibeticum]